MPAIDWGWIRRYRGIRGNQDSPPAEWFAERNSGFQATLPVTCLIYRLTPAAEKALANDRSASVADKRTTIVLHRWAILKLYAQASFSHRCYSVVQGWITYWNNGWPIKVIYWGLQCYQVKFSLRASSVFQDQW